MSVSLTPRGPKGKQADGEVFPMRRMMTSLAIVLGVALVAGHAAAQAPALDRTYQRAEKLSTEEKLQEASSAIEKMKSVLEAALVRLQSAREERDLIKVNCVNDKLSAIKGLLKISEQAEVGLKEAVARNDQELVNHEFTKISIARARVDNLRVEVDGCVGELASYTGETIVERTIDGEIRDIDPSEEAVVLFTPVDFLRPPSVSASD